MSRGSFSGWEIDFMRKLYFHEMVIGSFDSMSLVELFGCNQEMNDIEEFSDWIERQGLQEDFKKWLYDRGYESIDDYYQLYQPTNK